MDWSPCSSLLSVTCGTQLVIVITPIGFIGVIKQTFLFRNLTATNYARLKVGHHVVDLLGGELGRGRVELSTVTGAPTSTILKGWHSSARAPATDCELELLRIEPRSPQISSGWRFVAFLFTIRKGAMTIGTSAVPPRRKAGFHFVFILRQRGG